jgi:CheY-like chemotaxis protein
MCFERKTKNIMGSLNGPILILEDDFEERELLSEMLKKIGNQNEIKFFDAGDVFLNYLQTTSDQPFIILSDVNLPRINGLEVKKTINDSDFLRKKSIPFVFLSTTAANKAVEQAYDLNTQGYFVKQPTIDGIENHLRIILEYWRECKHVNN